MDFEIIMYLEDQTFLEFQKIETQIDLQLRVILRKWDNLKERVRMEVGDGRHCRVWLDPWL